MLAMLRFECLLCVILFALLVLKLVDADRWKKNLLSAIQGMLLVNFLIGWLPIESGRLFQGFFVSNDLILLEKNILNLGVLLVSVLGTKWLERSPYMIEFFILMISSQLGSFLMLSSGHILMLYLGIEMSTIPLTALANFNKKELRSSEAGIKYIMLSAFSSGIMLYGISLLYGAYGNLDFSFLKTAMTPNLLTLLAISFMLGGFFFKMSAVPFHMWAADVYEGAPIAVTSYLSVVSKGAITFVFVSILLSVFQNLKGEWLQIISIIAVLTMTIGNLFAMRQKNLKRFLAFSSISQMGFVLVGLTGSSKLGVDSTIYFMLIYMLSNIVCFGVLGAVAEDTGREDIDSYKGFYRTNRFLGLVMGIGILSMAGIPPTSGFFGKLFLLASSMGDRMYWVIGFAGINLVLSLYNYLRIIKVMFIDKPEVTLEVERPWMMRLTLIACCAAILMIGFISSFFEYIDVVGRQVF